MLFGLPNWQELGVRKKPGQNRVKGLAHLDIQLRVQILAEPSFLFNSHTLR